MLQNFSFMGHRINNYQKFCVIILIPTFLSSKALFVYVPTLIVETVCS